MYLRRPLTCSIVSWKPLNVSMVSKRPLEIFNGFWGNHHHWMFFCSLTIAINGFSMVVGLATIAFNGFRWFCTIGQTMRWFRCIAMVYTVEWILHIWWTCIYSVLSQLALKPWQYGWGRRLWVCPCPSPKECFSDCDVFFSEKKWDGNMRKSLQEAVESI